MKVNLKSRFLVKVSGRLKKGARQEESDTNQAELEVPQAPEAVSAEGLSRDTSVVSGCEESDATGAQEPASEPTVVKATFKEKVLKAKTSFSAKSKSFFANKKFEALGLRVDSQPLLLIVGSLTGVTVKDAKLFADGLAEKFITSPKLARVHVQSAPDKSRIFYEVHEGGAGYSIINKLLERLQTQRSVRIELANEGHVEISDEYGELVTLHYPAGTHDNLGGVIVESAMTPYVPLEELYSKYRIAELFPERRGLVIAGAAVMVVSALMFFVAGFFFTVAKSGFFDKDPVFTMGVGGFPPSVDDNPYWMLNKAMQEANAGGRTITKLEKVGGKWNWVLSPSRLESESTDSTTPAGDASSPETATPQAAPKEAPMPVPGTAPAEKAPAEIK